MLGIAEGILKHNFNISWRANASIFDLGRLETADFALLERSGLDRLFVGIENVSPRIQKLMNKKYDPEICEPILQRMKPFQIQFMASMIMGNPTETIEDMELNRRYLSHWLRINPHLRYQISFYTPYPGTAMTNLATTLGYTPPKTLEEFGSSIYFQDVERTAKQTIPWFSPEFSTQYQERFKELFQDAHQFRDAEWNWRKKPSQA